LFSFADRCEEKKGKAESTDGRCPIGALFYSASEYSRRLPDGISIGLPARVTKELSVKNLKGKRYILHPSLSGEAMAGNARGENMTHFN
jgi:hypothetical protein